MLNIWHCWMYMYQSYSVQKYITKSGFAENNDQAWCFNLNLRKGEALSILSVLNQCSDQFNYQIIEKDLVKLYIYFVTMLSFRVIDESLVIITHLEIAMLKSLF